MSKTVAVIGITGNQGSSVAETFLTEGTWHVRGTTRDPSKPAVQKWTSRGAEVIAADIDDVSSLKSAFQGANVIFGITDFWQFMFNPSLASLAQAQGRTINELAYDRELQHGKNIIDAAAANISTLDRFVLSTVNSAEQWSKGKFKWIKHFDAKWAAVEYLRATYPELAEKTNLLQLGVYASQFNGEQGPKKQEDGSYKMSLPVSGEVKLPLVVPYADAGPMARALVDLPAGKNVLVCGSFMTLNDFWKLWGEHVGVKCVFEKIDRKFYDENMGMLGTELADMFQYMEEFGYDGGDPDVLYPWDVEKELGRPIKRMTMEEYVKSEDWSSVLK